MPTIGSPFGLARVDLVTPGSTPTYQQIVGAAEVEFNSEIETVEVTGDDAVVCYWNHGLKGEITVKGNIVDLEVIEAITGNEVTSVSGPPARDYLYGGTEHDLQVPEFMLRVQQRAKHPTTGAACTHQIIFFRCIGSIKLTGAKYGEPTGIEIKAKLLQSTKDERQQTIQPAMWREEYIAS